VCHHCGSRERERGRERERQKKVKEVPRWKETRKAKKTNLVGEMKYCKLFSPHCSTRVISGSVEVYPKVRSSQISRRVSCGKKYVPQFFSCSGFEVQGLTNALKLSSKSLVLCGGRESEVFPFAFLSASAFSGKWRRKSRRRGWGY